MCNILYCGLLYNYGKSEEGFSYEHFNIEAGFKDCVDRGIFNRVDYLYPDKSNDINNSAMEMVIDGNYDAIFTVAFNEHLDFPEAAAKMALRKDIPVIQWDCDSSWRFQNWIAPRKDRVSHFVTTHSQTVDWYERFGMKVIRSQWGGSPYYHPQDVEQQYDVTFVGQKHGQFQQGNVMKYWRAEVVDAIMNAGVKLDLFGNYWDGYENWHGYQTDFHAMIRAFAQSKICLNLSNPWHHGTMPQIKGRHFEIPQIGRLQVCTPADDLASYFVDGQEIVVANSTEDLIDKLKYFLEHSDEREKIAAAGRARMLKEHQWYHRFEHIFKEVGVL